MLLVSSETPPNVLNSEMLRFYSFYCEFHLHFFLQIFKCRFKISRKLFLQRHVSRHQQTSIPRVIVRSLIY